MQSLFVTGTDTGVGKTVVCGLLAGYLRGLGIGIVTQKWIQTGGDTGDNDLTAHCHWAGGGDEAWTGFEEDRVPCRYAMPASPHLAATQAGQPVNTDRIQAAFARLVAVFDCVIVEGIGGTLVPIDERRLVVDIVQKLRLPTLVVVANKLGAINHTLLTVEALRARKLEILGLIFNDCPDTDPDIAENNPGIVEQHTGIPVLGRLPWTSKVSTAEKAFIPIGERLMTHREWIEYNTSD